MIASAVRSAQRAHRAAVEATYDGKCAVYGMRPVKDAETKVTRREETLVRRDIPCHLSYSSVGAAVHSETAASVSQMIKLFLAPEMAVEPGSRIEVTQQGRTESYAQSGKAAVYDSHQEILLELREEWA